MVKQVSGFTNLAVSNKLKAKVIEVGNTATINSTFFSATANNADNLAGYAGITGVEANTYGSSSSIPVLTLDPTGRVTAVNSVAVAGVTSYSYESSNNTFSLQTGDGNTFVASIDTVNNFTITGNLEVRGDTTISGNVTVIGANNLAVVDNMIYLNSNNQTVGLNVDTGIVSNYNSNGYYHTGLFRDHTDGVWKVFDGYTPEPDQDINIDTADPSFRIADFQANTLTVENISLANGIFANSSYGSNGQVLTTDGANAFWATKKIVNIGNSAPSPVTEGDLWWDPDSATMYVYYDDGSSLQWIEATPKILYESPTGVFTLSGNFVVTNDLTVQGTLYETSDQRLKTNISTITDPVATVNLLRGVNFDWKRDGKRSVGVIAQEVERVLPQLVNTYSDGEKAVNYTGLIGLLIEAVKELSAKVDNK